MKGQHVPIERFRFHQAPGVMMLDGQVQELLRGERRRGRKGDVKMVPTHRRGVSEELKETQKKG
ncbi:MAG: hypothetical protein WDN28_29155 [Chthoniobacter sp.]